MTFTHSAMVPESNDYHILPATERQISFARSLAARNKVSLPEEIRADRAALSRWIDKQASTSKARTARFDAIPSARQVAFAEGIARRKRRVVPRECFKDKGLMSAWITSNK